MIAMRKSADGSLENIHMEVSRIELNGLRKIYTGCRVSSLPLEYASES